MISRITGKVEEATDNALVLRVGGVSYEVLIPTAVMEGLGGRTGRDAELTLVTYHYYQTDPSKSIPILIGFANALEKEFFERFITVSGVGPKAALRALSAPIADIAEAIDTADLAFLKSLPGIGEQRAKEIIAKLQGKMAKFGLVRRGDTAARGASPGKGDLENEALDVLLQLQYKKEEAREMVRKAFARSGSLKSVEEVLNEVYRQGKSDGQPKTAAKVRAR